VTVADLWPALLLIVAPLPAGYAAALILDGVLALRDLARAAATPDPPR
jgi:hypothetical protein